MIAPRTSPPYGSIVSAAVLAPIILVVVLVIVDGWIYTDARAHRDRGETVVVRIGSVTIDTPEAWLAACLALSLLFIPLYLVARDQA